MKSIPWLNQSLFDGHKDRLLRTSNMGFPGRGPGAKKGVVDKEGFASFENQRRWGVANTQVGEKAGSSLVVSFFSGLVSDYLNILEESPFLNVIKKFFTAMSSSTEGLRDHWMYKHLYGQGIDKNLTEAELKDQDKAIASGKISAPDDWMENKKQELLYGENIVAKAGELATRAAALKPAGNIITSLLPTEYKRLIDTIIDLPAKCYWRARFFGGSLHANFLTTAVNLVKHGVGSIVFSTSREKLTTLKKELHEKSVEYFKDKGLNVTGDSSSLGLYFNMLKDRLGEHWRGFRNPNKVVGEKLDKGLITDEDKVSERRQKLASITDLTAPFCAAFGLIGTIVFDPLSKICAIANIETGKNLLNAAASSRKLFQLANYIPRFIIPEWNSGDRTKEYKWAVQGEAANDPKHEVARQLYYAHKARGQNGLFGFLVAALNIAEPFAHLSGVADSESRLVKFMFSTLQRVGDTGFLQFFTKRRQHMGEEAFALSLVREIDHRDKRAENRKDPVQVDFTDINHTLKDMNRIAQETTDKIGVKTESVIHDMVINPVTRVSKSLSSREVFTPQKAYKFGTA